MKKKIPVSVVVPCYRCKDTIFRTINSILNQTVLPLQVVLVDDFSNDGTVDIVADIILDNKHLIDFKLLQLAKNYGAANARNSGWNIATQPYIAFLDADDSWHPAKLEIQYQYMIDNNIDVSGHLCSVFDSLINTVDAPPKSMRITTITSKSLLFKNAFSTPTVMLKRDIPIRFQPNKRYAEDFMLWQEIAFNHYQMVRIEMNLAYVYKDFYGASGLSANLWLMEKGELSNFFYLQRKKYISLSMCFFAMLFSFIKFVRRVFCVCVKRK
jgi:glycosyltransferase involved in cell wall biosynthesis